jgi:RpiR family carbohydrate utilization transcriptional regulator
LSSSDSPRGPVVTAPPPPREIRLVTTIRAIVPSLVPTERRVAEALLAHSEAAAGWSVADMAAAADVSPAAVVRASQSLGFTGFNGLRARLAQELAGPAQPTVDADDAIAVVRGVMAAGLSQIEGTLAILDAEELTAAVDALTPARRVLVSGTGDLGSVATYAALRFSLVGRPAEAPIDPAAVHAAAASLEAGCVCLVLGQTGKSDLTVRTASIAADRGATVIAITGWARAPIAEHADVHLVLGVPDPALLPAPFAETRVGHGLMVDALATAVGLRLGRRGEEARAELRDVIVRDFLHRRPD